MWYISMCNAICVYNANNAISNYNAVAVCEISHSTGYMYSIFRHSTLRNWHCLLITEHIILNLIENIAD